MTQQFITGNHWLEPVMPSPGFPPSLLQMAETLPFKAGVLTGLLPAGMAMRIGFLMRVTWRCLLLLWEWVLKDQDRMG